MARLVLTGASGYIGKRLTEMARDEGHQLVILGRRRPDIEAVFFSWTLGEEAPLAALMGADAFIHLAHSWAADSAPGENANEAAAERLARQALAAGIPRFVLASTTSARANARNRYGQVKFAMEKALAGLPDAEGRVVSARIALVYGGTPAGQYRLMRKLAALTPVLPMLGLDREVQPIHLDEVCRGLLKLALGPALAQPSYVLAGDAITFAQWLRTLRLVQTGGRLRLIPIPENLMLRACEIFPFLRERVLGLLGAEAMAGNLQALGIVPADPFVVLRQEEGRVGEAEARALLQYLAETPLTLPMQRDLATGLARAGLSPLGLPVLLRNHPGLIALTEPPATARSNRLGQALQLAAQVLEAHAPPPPRPGIFKTAWLVLWDLLLLPLRLLAAGKYR